MNVGDIIKHEHNETNIKTGEKIKWFEEEVITQEKINKRIIALYEEGKAIADIEAEFKRPLIQEELDLYNSKVANKQREEALAELAELDNVVSREYENVLKAFDDLKAELETNHAITINTKPYVDQYKLDKIARKEELRNQL